MDEVTKALWYHRIATRVVDTGGAAKNTVINKGPTLVHWLAMSAQTIGTQGTITLYDGFDAGGKKVYQYEPGYARHTNFMPPIPCEQGLFIASDTGIASFSVGYNVTKPHGLKENERPGPVES